MFPSPWRTRAGTPAEQAANRRETSLPFFGQRGSATKISAKNLTMRGFEKESHRSGVRVLLPGPPSGDVAGVLSMTRAELGHRPTPSAESSFSGKHPSAAKGMGALRRPHPKLCEHDFFLEGEEESRLSLQTDGIFGSVCKLETQGPREKGTKSFVEEAPSTVPGTKQHLRAQTRPPSEPEGRAGSDLQPPSPCPDVLPTPPPSTQPRAVPAVSPSLQLP